MAVCHPAPKLGWIATVAAYGGGAFLMFAASHRAIPYLVALGMVPPLAWFIAGGIAFGLLLVAALLLLAKDGCASHADILQRARFHPIDRIDVALIGAVGIGTVAFTALWAASLAALWPGFEPQPWFIRSGPLADASPWILLAWVPMFLLNIMGEELLWHGWLLPGQERVFGRFAWIPAGLGWILFHAPFGLGTVLLFAPFLLIETYAVRRTHNLWIGVWLHVVFNASGILATLFGLAS
ncbi:MAG TPA: CPBP family intramembrane glutamic endopeptidase [Candidatus Baltobacteraceae bacterium]|nr:CPBP family intramembrane glutamic endopeptidase [Candidatus Baltobacteraceae bacterium]